jgi:hypothetical protein
MAVKPRPPIFKDVSTPGWWLFRDEKGRYEDAWTLVFAAGTWWRTCSFVGNVEAMVVESDKAELDQWYGPSGREAWMSLAWACATKSQQDLWTAENPTDPLAPLVSIAVNKENAVVEALYQAIENAGTGDLLTMRLFRGQNYPIKLLRKSNPEWGSIATRRAAYRKFLDQCDQAKAERKRGKSDG